MNRRRDAVLRPLTVDDAPEMVRVLADPALYRHTGGSPPTLSELRERYARQVTGVSPDGVLRWFNWIAVDSATGDAVGYVQATVDPAAQEAELAWVVGTPWQGRGLATGAAAQAIAVLEARGTTRFTAHIHPRNRASAALARRLGLHPTGQVVDKETTWVRELPGRPPG